MNTKQISDTLYVLFFISGVLILGLLIIRMHFKEVYFKWLRYLEDKIEETKDE